MCAIMPERIAATDPFKQVTGMVGCGMVGCGPFRFERVPGCGPEPLSTLVIPLRGTKLGEGGSHCPITA
jgi:hypothetical protein